MEWGPLTQSVFKSDQIKTSLRMEGVHLGIRQGDLSWKKAGLWRSSSFVLAHPVATQDCWFSLPPELQGHWLAHTATMELGREGRDPHKLKHHGKPVCSCCTQAAVLEQMLLFLFQNTLGTKVLEKLTLMCLASVLAALTEGRLSEVLTLQLWDSKGPSLVIRW